jgi:hypothetical protein
MSFRQVTNPHIKNSVVTMAIAALLLVAGTAAAARTDLPVFGMAMRLSSLISNAKWPPSSFHSPQSQSSQPAAPAPESKDTRRVFPRPSTL